MNYVPKTIFHVPTDLWFELELHLGEIGLRVGAETFTAKLIEDWLIADKRRLEQLAQSRNPLGYQWKDVFLPHGTMLRTSSNGVSKFAQVEGERIVAEGRVVSPSRFANEQSVRRNAWRCVWLRFPKQEHWERAADSRLRQSRQRSKN